MSEGIAVGMESKEDEVSDAMSGVVENAIGSSSSTVMNVGTSPRMIGTASPTMGGGQTFNITVNAGMGADGTVIGQKIVDQIKSYERANGSGWRAS